MQKDRLRPVLQPEKTDVDRSFQVQLQSRWFWYKKNQSRLRLPPNWDKKPDWTGPRNTIHHGSPQFITEPAIPTGYRCQCVPVICTGTVCVSRGVVSGNQTNSIGLIQFPLTLAFVMTINKYQGQSLKHVGLDFRSPIFTHGQFYVAVSWSTSLHRIDDMASWYTTQNKEHCISWGIIRFDRTWFSTWVRVGSVR